MVRLEYILFGYCELALDSPRELLNLALRHSRSAAVTERGTVIISLPTARLLKKELEKLGVKRVGEPRGIGGAVIGVKSHVPSLVALLLAVFVYVYSCDLVFDVRVEGNESVSEEKIIAELESVGFGVGSRWSKTDRNAVELAVLDGSDTLAWISINRQGRVATVTVIELASGILPPEDNTPCNIVADRDCVIEEITVVSGTPAVKVGDTVRRGELLISGIVETERGTSYVKAEGTVRGRASESVTTEQERTVVKTELSEDGIATVALKILNFRINIFKSYGNQHGNYAIIESNKNIVANGVRLPVSIICGKYVLTHEWEQTLSDAELPSAAGLLHTERLNGFLDGKDLISIRTNGRYTDGGYLMESLVVYSAEVGRAVRIGVDSSQ